jgi:hypothetical protein
MIRPATLFSALAAVLCLSGAAATHAGSPGCGCSQGPVSVAPMADFGPIADPDREISADYGGDGELFQSGSLYGSGGHYGGFYGSPHPRSFESGFENLPDMDGRGVHHRLPFHSYRRPWAHPGIADTNINIVW